MLLLLIVSLFLIIIFRSNYLDFLRSNQSLNNSLIQCQENKNYIKNTSCIKKNLESLVINYGPSHTLKFAKDNNLQVSYNLNNNIECHDFAHLLGTIAGEVTKDIGESIDRCGEDCSSGCYHGFFEGIKKNPLIPDLDYENICLRQVAKEELVSGCLHAQGHYFMELNQNILSDGFKKCLALKTTDKNKKSCLSGGFMEAQTLRDNKIMTPSTPNMPAPEDYFQFCQKFSGLVLDYCLQDGGSYVYRFTLNPKMATNFCIDYVSKSNQEGCLSSVGGFFHRKNPNIYLEYISKYCRLAKNDFTFSCFAGGVESIHLGGQDIQPLITICIEQKILPEQDCQKLLTIKNNKTSN